MQYGQFCPVAKATEIIGEKWTILILREILMGGTRFNELQRGLGLISPTVLTKRLNALEGRGLVLKRRIKGQRGYEYLPTASCRELLPVIRSLGEWGMRWARTNLTETDYDVELLMLYLQRSVIPENLPGDQAVVRFRFTDIEDPSRWWLLVEGDDVDVCTNDPGMDVDVSFITSVKTMAGIWMGDTTYRRALKEGDLKITGPSALTRDIGSWLANSIFADMPPAAEI